MKKHVLFLFLMFLAFTFSIQAQPNNAISKNDIWLHYDTEAYYNSLGYHPGGNLMHWAVMFPADKLQPYENHTLTKVAYYKVHDVSDLLVSVYYGDDNHPVSLISEQSFATDGLDIGYHYIELVQPVEIDVTQNLWIVLSETKVTEKFSGTCCKLHNSPIIPDPNARWVSAYPGYWEDIANNGWDEIQWKIRACLIDDPTGVEKSLTYDAPTVYPNPTIGGFTVEGAKVTKVEVYNLVGQKMSEAEGQSVYIDATDWNKGIYLIHIKECNGAVTTQKLVIK